MEASWIPKTKPGLESANLDLDPEEGFVLSRIDGATPVGDLVFLTGLPKAKVEDIVGRLAALGALEPSGPAPDGGEARGSGPLDEAAEGGYRRIYQRQLRSLPLDARVELAGQAGGANLLALCFDPSPRVALTLLENPRFGLPAARLLARYHASPQGLDALGQRSAFLRDRAVERHLLRNGLAPESLLQRLFRSKPMAQAFRLASGRELAERARATAQKAFRQQFQRGSAEERVDLILKTEGRCLALLVGVPLDGKTTALLCRRPLASTLLVHNLARWPSTPPPVLRHLARQPAVRRSPQLRNQVLRHPNAPSGLTAEP
ncbi:MAG: hypothetical protein MI919_11250 [Holophagales bacterium]|nr:hypothetical protein [Holophagales bacterium]